MEFDPTKFDIQIGFYSKSRSKIWKYTGWFKVNGAKFQFGTNDGKEFGTSFNTFHVPGVGRDTLIASDRLKLYNYIIELLRKEFKVWSVKKHNPPSEFDDFINTIL